MDAAGFLAQCTILFGTALAVTWLFRFLRVPSIIGFLITGMLIGPSVLQLIRAEQVETFAEVGLVLLLFVIGIELAPAPLFRLGVRLFAASVLQSVVITVIALGILLRFGGLGLLPAFILALAPFNSSSAIVLKVFSDRGELRSLVGRMSAGVSLIQDAMVIVVMLLLPLAAVGDGGGAGHGGGAALYTVLGFSGIAAGTVGMRFVLPRLLHELTRRRAAETTALFAVVMACGGAWAAQVAGWPPALGACIAGLLLAQADIRHQVVAEIAPFRDVFNAVFFISLGMLADLRVVVDHGGVLLGAIVLTLVVKSLVNTVAFGITGWPLRVSLHAGLALCTVSEFGYVLAYEANRMGMLPPGALRGLIPYAVGSMVAGAFLVPVSGRISAAVARVLDGRRGEGEGEAEEAGWARHVILVGYGVNGENLARVLSATQIPHCVIEVNRPVARKAMADGKRVIVGDGSRMSILRSAGIRHAQAMVVAINDSGATRQIIAQARAYRPDLYIIARTWHASEIEALVAAGANMVVPADYEVSIKIFAQLLTELRVPDNLIQAQIAAMRAGGYGVLRGETAMDAARLQDLLAHFRLSATQTWYVRAEAYAAGRSIGELNLRKETGVSIVAIVREGHALANPGPGTRLASGDVLVLVGSHAELQEANRLLESGTLSSA
jgi:CPA2 family monovalent cation:H+ antiporter-2